MRRMKNLLFVVFLLLSCSGFASDLDDAVHSIESEWASIYFSAEHNGKEHAYSRLFNRTIELSKDRPDSPELLFWQATILASRAEHLNPIDALAAIHRARDMLLKTIAIKPDTLNGSALITLGALYYQAPAWPIAFGDNEKAEKYLRRGLEINPKGIESNYYFGEYLLHQDRADQALKYFEAALKGPIRKEQHFADVSLKQEIKKKLAKVVSAKSQSKKNQIASIASESSAMRN